MKQVLFPSDITPNAGADTIARLGQEHGIDHILLAVFSSVENEVPAQLPLSGFQQGGLSRGSVLGYQAQSYALVELALLGARTGRVLVAADGRAWSELERLNVPLESNVYPVVRRSQRQAPIYPTEENAKDVMRGVATSEAIDQAVMHLAEAWQPGPVERNPG